MKTVLIIIYGVYLLVLALIDIKNKQIPVKWLFWALLFIPLFIITGADGVSDHVLGFIPGGVFFCISFICKGQIGPADAFIVLCTGGCVGLKVIITAVSVSLLGIAGVSAVMLITGKMNRKSTIPYIPFVLFGYVIAFLLKG